MCIDGKKKWKMKRTEDGLSKVVTNLDFGIEGKHRTKMEADGVSFKCFVSMNGRKCPYGPFKNCFHLDSHMKLTKCGI